MNSEAISAQTRPACCAKSSGPGWMLYCWKGKIPCRAFQIGAVPADYFSDNGVRYDVCHPERCQMRFRMLTRPCARAISKQVLKERSADHVPALRRVQLWGACHLDLRASAPASWRLALERHA